MTTKSYSLDLRIRVISAIAWGISCRAAARYFGIPPSTAIRYQQRMNQTLFIEPFKQGRPFLAVAGLSLIATCLSLKQKSSLI